jgi:hypothetical protein
MIEDQSPRDHDEPSGESAPSVGGVRAQPTAAVLAKRLEHVGVAVHCGIAVACDQAAGVQQDATVRRDELRPGLVEIDPFGGVQQACQRRRNAGLAGNFIRRGDSRSDGVRDKRSGSRVRPPSARRKEVERHRR